MATIKICHPDIAVTGEASEEAFIAVWAPRGWQRVDDITASAIDALGVNVTSLDQLSKQQLLEYAATGNFAVTGDMTVEEIIATIEAGTKAEPAATSDPGTPDEPAAVDLDAMTKQELVDLAQGRGITDATMSKSKPDLIEMITSQS